MEGRGRRDETTKEAMNRAQAALNAHPRLKLMQSQYIFVYTISYLSTTSPHLITVSVLHLSYDDPSFTSPNVLEVKACLLEPPLYIY